MQFTLINKGIFTQRAGVLNIFSRQTGKIAVEVESKVLRKIVCNDLKPRCHPGINKPGNCELPNRISEILKRLIGDYPVKKLIKDCKKLNQYIRSRHPPMEINETKEKMRSIAQEIDKNMQTETLSNQDDMLWRCKRERLIKRLFEQRTYAWTPIAYGAYESLVYAIARGAHEFTVLKHILREISSRDLDFQPRSYFDFGSGVGTGMWAANDLWSDSIFEYYNVDSSRHMNELSELILREGYENKQVLLRNVHYRQFLPGIDTKFDLVISSHSLFEIPNAASRLDVILNLWRKCVGYLVIIEEGSRRGSELVNEARTIILNLKEEELRGHVFAPCANDGICPRLADTSDRTPCNFELSYTPFRFGDFQKDRLSARYSYVVLKKGLATDRTRNWPRLVRPTLVRSKHAICRMCTAEAKLQEIIFTKSKHGKYAYRCAKVSRWGDRLPITIEEVLNNEDNFTTEEKNKSDKEPQIL